MCFDSNVSTKTNLKLVYSIESSEETIEADSDLCNIIDDLKLVFDEKAINDRFNCTPNGFTFINQLQQQYIKTEKFIWSVIEVHLNSSDHVVDLLELIRISHDTLFDGNFRENAIHLNLFDAYDEILYGNILVVNQSIQRSQKTYLNNPEILNDRENELPIMLVVQDQLDLRKTLDDIYAYISSNKDYIQSVSSYFMLSHCETSF